MQQIPVSVALATQIIFLFGHVKDDDRACEELGGILYTYIGLPDDTPMHEQLLGLAINDLDQLHDEVTKLVRKYEKRKTPRRR